MKMLKKFGKFFCICYNMHKSRRKENDKAKECIIKAEEICSVIFENEDNQLYQNVLHAKYALENLGYVF